MGRTLVRPCRNVNSRDWYKAALAAVCDRDALLIFRAESVDEGSTSQRYSRRGEERLNGFLSHPLKRRGVATHSLDGPLGLVRMVTLPDSSEVHTDYQGVYVTVTDQAGR